MAIGTIANGESGSSVRTKLNSAITQLNGSVIGADVQAYDANTAKLDTAQDWTAKQTFNLFEADAGTLTADSPVVISQTWNNAAVAFTGLKIDITDTASSSDATPFIVDVGGGYYTKVKKNGGLVVNTTASIESIITRLAIINYFYTPGFGCGSAGLIVYGSKGLNFTSATNVFGGTDLKLTRDAADVFAQYRSTNPQTYRIYNTYTSETNYERAKFAWESNRFVIGTEAETGTKRGITLDATDLILSSLPTSDPSVAGQLWLDGASLKVSAG